jgi:hypothetical protein
MKTRKIYTFASILAICVFGLFFIGCDIENPDENDNGNSNNNTSNTNENNGNTNVGGVYLTGTYKRYMVSSGTYNDYLNFTNTNITFSRAGSTIINGNYKFDGSTLTLTIGGVNHVKYATVDGNNLYITGDGAYSEYIKDRWVKQ